MNKYEIIGDIDKMLHHCDDATLRAIRTVVGRLVHDDIGHSLIYEVAIRL